MPSDCRDCIAATERMWHGFRRDCRGCQARMVARSPEFAIAKRAGRIVAGYRRVLELTGLTHEQVKAAAAADALGKAAA